MDKQEAKAALEAGATVKHSGFTGEEWVEKSEHGDMYRFEDGCVCNADEFWRYRTEAWWDDGWSIVENKP